MTPPQPVIDTSRIKEVSGDFYAFCLEKEATFDDLQTFLMSPEVCNAYKASFRGDYRVALGAFACAFFDIEERLVGIAREFLECLMDGGADRILLLWEQYRLLFAAWKEQDSQEMLEKLAQMYWEYEINYRMYEEQLTPDEREYYTEEKQKRQEECMAMMQRMDGGMDYFQQFTPVFVDSSTSHVLAQTLRRAFWDKLGAEWSATPPVCDGLWSLLKEIRGHLETLVGRSRPEWLREYDEYFDMAFLQQRAAQPGAFMTAAFWAPRCAFLQEILIGLDSAERQTKHEAVWESLKKQEESFIFYTEFLEYFMTRLLEIVHLVDFVRDARGARDAP
jgi:hypothetical protein